MLYINQVPALGAVPRSETMPPSATSVEHQYTEVLPPSSSTVYYSENSARGEWARVRGTIGRLAGITALAIVGGLLAVNAAEGAPATDQRQEYYHPQYPGMNPAQMDPNVVRLNPDQVPPR